MNSPDPRFDDYLNLMRSINVAQIDFLHKLKAEKESTARLQEANNKWATDTINYADQTWSYVTTTAGELEQPYPAEYLKENSPFPKPGSKAEAVKLVNQDNRLNQLYKELEPSPDNAVSGKLMKTAFSIAGALTIAWIAISLPVSLFNSAGLAFLLLLLWILATVIGGPMTFNYLTKPWLKKEHLRIHGGTPETLGKLISGGLPLIAAFIISAIIP